MPASETSATVSPRSSRSRSSATRAFSRGAGQEMRGVRIPNRAVSFAVTRVSSQKIASASERARCARGDRSSRFPIGVPTIEDLRRVSGRAHGAAKIARGAADGIMPRGGDVATGGSRSAFLVAAALARRDRARGPRRRERQRRRDSGERRAPRDDHLRRSNRVRRRDARRLPRARARRADRPAPPVRGCPAVRLRARRTPRTSRRPWRSSRERLRAEGKDPAEEFARAGMTADDVRASLERQLVVQRYLKERFRAGTVADEERARTEYDERLRSRDEGGGPSGAAVRGGRRGDARPRRSSAESTTKSTSGSASCATKRGSRSTRRPCRRRGLVQPWCSRRRLRSRRPRRRRRKPSPVPRARPRPQPGGQENGRPPSRCRCRWKTDWPAPSPLLITIR